jgi:hypothetical protein
MGGGGMGGTAQQMGQTYDDSTAGYGGDGMGGKLGGGMGGGGMGGMGGQPGGVGGMGQNRGYQDSTY